MSIQALAWAIGVQVSRSSHKCVLLCLANYAGVDGLAYPSHATLARDACCDIKTVPIALHALAKSGHIQDTGQRRGYTQQTTVYRLAPEGEGPQTKLGLPEEISKVSVFPTRSSPKVPVFPPEGPRFSHQPPPKTGTEPSINLESEPRVTRAPRGGRLPEAWDPSAADSQYAVAHNVNPALAAEEFKNYWLARSGRDAVKLDWSRTFRNRVLELQSRGRFPAAVPRQNGFAAPASDLLNPVRSAGWIP